VIRTYLRQELEFADGFVNSLDFNPGVWVTRRNAKANLGRRMSAFFGDGGLGVVISVTDDGVTVLWSKEPFTIRMPSFGTASMGMGFSMGAYGATKQYPITTLPNGGHFYTTGSLFSWPGVMHPSTGSI
jgi:hypothetical protein